MSEAWLWTLGLFMAVFGPLFFLVPIYLLSRYPLRWALAGWLQRRYGRSAGWIRRGLALVIVVAAVLLSWLPGRLELSRQCELHQRPVIKRLQHADGFYRETMFAYEAEQYLREWGFSWVEAPDPYRYQQSPRYLRYSKGADGKTELTEIPAPSAELSVSSTHQELPGDLSLSLKRISVRASGEELAHAGSAIYHGGPLSLLLGVYGVAHCPDPRSAEGGKFFDDYYYLERKVMRGE